MPLASSANIPSTPHPPGEQPAGAQSRSRNELGASDHPTRAGGIQYRQQLFQHRSRCRAVLRVVHHSEDPRREAGLDLLQAHRAVHQQLGADVGGRQGMARTQLPSGLPMRAAAKDPNPFRWCQGAAKAVKGRRSRAKIERRTCAALEATRTMKRPVLSHTPQGRVAYSGSSSPMSGAPQGMLRSL